MMNRNPQKSIAQIIYQATSAESEKRKHFRLSLRLPTEYSFPESSRLHLAHTVDICEAGLSMSTPKNLDIGQNLSLKFYYDSAVGIDCIQAPGEVIRVDRVVNSGKEYKCAIRFSDLPPDFLKKLRQFLKSLY